MLRSTLLLLSRTVVTSLVGADPLLLCCLLLPIPRLRYCCRAPSDQQHSTGAEGKQVMEIAAVSPHSKVTLKRQ